MATQRESSPAREFDALAAAVKPPLDTLSAGFRLWMEEAERLRAESTRFVLERFGKDAGLAASLAACRQPKDFVDLQARGLREFVSDYLRESVRLTSMSIEAWRHGLGLATSAAPPGRADR